MNAAPVWKPPRSALSSNFTGLLDKLVKEAGVIDLDLAQFQTFTDGTGFAVVLLTEEPDTAPESWDMAVIFPELLNEIEVSSGVMHPENSRIIASRFSLGRLPALLFFRDGEYIGSLEGLRDWSDFIAEVANILKSPARALPAKSIAISATSSSCH
jgi:hydrogenase-1 operon protein HyaE